MTRFRYTGNSDRPQVILGLTFTADDWTEVPADLAGRLSGHSHLERGDEDGELEAAEPAKRRGRPPKDREG